jgi:DNA-binding transcriptional ArsR family regulator
VFAYRTEGFAALDDPTRRDILARIAERPRAVGELARELPVSRPAVSQHLNVLKDAGLVIDCSEGARRIYHADPAGLAALRAQLDTYWKQALATFGQVVEHDNKEE